MSQDRLSRRERRRLETYDEIVEVSRDLLREGTELSLRAVATEMGMTASALYRYVASAADLHRLIARSVYQDVVHAMVAARDRYPDDPPAQLAGSATAFRHWALHNKAEFRLIFAGPLSGYTFNRAPILGDTEAVDHRDGAKLFADYFAEIFVKLAATRVIKVPELNTLDPSMQDLIVNRSREPDRQLLEQIGADGPGVLWLFQLAWARLYGVVLLEAFDLVDPALIASGALFDVLMRENFDSLGLADSWDRLLEVSRDVVAVS